MGKPAAYCAFRIWWVGAVFCLAAAAEPPLVVRTFPLNQYKRVLDGQWQGIRYASDGNVYFASSTHSAHHGAAFFMYSPKTKKVTMLAEDLTRICGEDPETNPQGKMHSDIVEANGWLYMATHFSSEGPGAAEKWSGAHLLGYQMKTGKFRDFGVVHPNYTVYSAIGVDPKRNFVYVFVTGMRKGQVAYMYRINAVTGEKKNLGEVGKGWTSCFWTFVDRRGDVWFSMSGKNGAFSKVNGATGGIETFPDALPKLCLYNEEKVDPDPKHQAARWIMWMQPVDGDRAVFTLGYNGGMLYEFDSTRPVAGGNAFREVRHIGYTDLGLAVGGNRVFYYQRANRGFGHQGDAGPGGARDFHLLSVSLKDSGENAITDHGLLQDQDGRVVWRLPGMQTDGRGTVFMIGDWYLNPGEQGTKRYRYRDGEESYVELPRGEFFAVAERVVR